MPLEVLAVAALQVAEVHSAYLSCWVKEGNAPMNKAFNTLLLLNPAKALASVYTAPLAVVVLHKQVLPYATVQPFPHVDLDAKGYNPLIQRTLNLLSLFNAY